MRECTKPLVVRLKGTSAMEGLELLEDVEHNPGLHIIRGGIDEGCIKSIEVASEQEMLAAKS